MCTFICHSCSIVQHQFLVYYSTYQLLFEKFFLCILQEAMKNAEELIQEEEKERKKAEKRRAKKKVSYNLNLTPKFNRLSQICPNYQ